MTTLGVGTRRGPTSTARASLRPGPVLVRLLLVLTAILLGTALPASAHSTLERSDPLNGGMVATGRTELTLWFGEPVTDAGSSFSVRSTDPDVAPVPVTATLDEGNTVVHLTTPPLERDTYTITWAVVGDDGHPTDGTVIFGVGFRPDGVPVADSGAPDSLPLLVRLTDLGGTLLAIGALALSGRVVAALAGAGIRLRRRVLTAGALGAAASLAAALATPVLTARTQLGGSDASVSAWVSAVRDVLVGGVWGTLWMARLAALTVALVALWSARREATRRDAFEEVDASRGHGWAIQVATGAVIASASLDAWAGHASTLPARSTVAVLAAAGHVLAAGVWAGGLAVLVLGVVPVMRLDRGTRGPAALAGWRAYSPMAAVSAGVLVATGVYEMGRHVETVSSIWRSLYGSALVAKILLLVVALGIAGYNTLIVNESLARRIGPLLGQGPRWRPGLRGLATTVTAEALVLGVAVALAAVMTSVPTAREVDAAAAVTTPYTETVDNLFVTFEAVPAGSRVRLVVGAEPIVRPVRWPVTGVEVGLDGDTATTSGDIPATTGPGRLALEGGEGGRYEATTTSVPSGDWTALVVIHRSGRADSVLAVPWTTRSNAPTPMELATTGLAVVILTGIGVALVLRRRISGRTATPGPAVTGAGDLSEGDVPVAASREVSVQTDPVATARESEGVGGR